MRIPPLSEASVFGHGREPSLVFLSGYEMHSFGVVFNSLCFKSVKMHLLCQAFANMSAFILTSLICFFLLVCFYSICFRSC